MVNKNLLCCETTKNHGDPTVDIKKLEALDGMVCRRFRLEVEVSKNQTRGPRLFQRIQTVGLEELEDEREKA